MINAIFTEDGRQERCTGYTSVPYSSGNNETLIETSNGDPVSVFQNAKANGETLDGPDESIDAATEDPLAFLDYLVPVDGTIASDSDYVRLTPDQTQA